MLEVLRHVGAVVAATRLDPPLAADDLAVRQGHPAGELAGASRTATCKSPPTVQDDEPAHSVHTPPASNTPLQLAAGRTGEAERHDPRADQVRPVTDDAVALGSHGGLAGPGDASMYTSLSSAVAATFCYGLGSLLRGDHVIRWYRSDWGWGIIADLEGDVWFHINRFREPAPACIADGASVDYELDGSQGPLRSVRRDSLVLFSEPDA